MLWDGLLTVPPLCCRTVSRQSHRPRPRVSTPLQLLRLGRLLCARLIRTRDENDPHGPVELKEIEECFRSFAPIWHGTAQVTGPGTNHAAAITNRVSEITVQLQRQGINPDDVSILMNRSWRTALNGLGPVSSGANSRLRPDILVVVRTGREDTA